MASRGRPPPTARSAGYGDAHNLYSYIDRDRVWGLNIEPPESAKITIKPWHERDSLEAGIESSVDDQLILNVPFTTAVRIQSIVLNPGRGDLAPRVRGMPVAVG